MEIVKLDLQDSGYKVDVAVSDIAEVERIQRFMKWAYAMGDLRDEFTEVMNEVGENFALTVGYNESFEARGELFYKDTHLLRPGKDVSAAAYGGEEQTKERSEKFAAWSEARQAQLSRKVKDILAKADKE